MRMFLSVSGDSSELSIANHSSPQLTVNSIAAKMCLRHYIQLIWEFDKNLHRPFIQNSNQMASRLTTSQPQVFRGYFFNSCNFQGSQGYSDDKNWLDFSSIFFKICTFRSSILLSL